MIIFQHFASFDDAKKFAVFYDPSSPETCESWIDGIGPVLGRLPCGAHILPKEEYCEESGVVWVTADLPDDEGDACTAWVMRGETRWRALVSDTFFQVESDLYPA